MRPPDLAIESQLAQTCGGTVIAGMDEVGRGALAGPVAVGVAAVDIAVAVPREGLKDSKMLTALQRERLTLAFLTSVETAVGLASAGELDTYGLSAALGLGVWRAWHELVSSSGSVAYGLVLDGTTEWLQTAPEALCAPLAPMDALTV